MKNDIKDGVKRVKKSYIKPYFWVKGSCRRYLKTEIWSKRIVRGYKLATKFLKTQRKSIFSENMITKKPENMPFVTQGFPNLIREGGRTVGSGRVATIIE